MKSFYAFFAAAICLSVMVRAEQDSTFGLLEELRSHSLETRVLVTRKQVKLDGTAGILPSRKSCGEVIYREAVEYGLESFVEDQLDKAVLRCEENYTLCIPLKNGLTDWDVRPATSTRDQHCIYKFSIIGLRPFNDGL